MNRRTVIAIRRAFSLLLPIPLLLLTTGCWDRRELNDTAYALATAIDLEPNGQYKLSAGIPLAGQLGGKGGGGGTGEGKAFFIESEVGPSVNAISDKLQARMSRRLVFNHRRVLMVGEDFARKIGIRDIMDLVARNPENRLTSYLVVAEGSGEELLKAQPKLERFSAEAVREMVKSYSVTTINMKDVALALEQRGADPIVPCMRVMKREGKGENEKMSEVQIEGFAIFRGYHMVDILRSDAAKGVGWLREHKITNQYMISIAGEGERFSMTVLKGTSKAGITEQADGRLAITIKINAKTIVTENMSERSLTDLSTLSMLQNRTADVIKAEVNQALDAVRKHGSDFAGFGQLLQRHSPAIWDKHKDNWAEDLKHANFILNVSTDVVQTGLTTEIIKKR